MKYLRVKLLVVIAALACVAAFLSFEGLAITKHIQSADIRHQAGAAYNAHLSLSWPLRYRFDTETSPTASPTILFENQQKLGPAHSGHRTIEVVGNGKYSHWKEQLIFAPSDNTDPRTNGREYTAQLRIYARPSFFLLMLGLLVISVFITVPIKSALPLCKKYLFLFPEYLSRIPGVRWFVKDVLPGALISAVLITVIVTAGEVYIRMTTPFRANWPSRFDPRFGFNFVPGSTVNWTNNLDFWTTTQANSQGFLDREPPQGDHPAPDVCRVAFIGDSFVEAAQVPVEEKIQSQLEKFRKSGKPFETLAFGYSGTGQANQLPFYDVFARRFHPNVVVLVFVSNDFANNSSPLESIRNGWDPVHPPRPFFERSASGEFQAIPIDPNWTATVFNIIGQTNNWHSATHGFLVAHSYLYNWIYIRLSLQYPTIARWLDAQVPWDSIHADRKREVSKRWPEKFDLSGWNFPGDWDMDNMFFADHLAPVFNEALALTGHALDEFSERSHRDGFSLVILADKSLHLQGSYPSTTNAEKQNPLSTTGQIDRLRELARTRNIPVVDLHAYIQSIHEDPQKASYPHDGHWSPHGHQWAAQALNEYFRHHPEVCENKMN